jgi:Serpin (serine protease inhibitor)
VKTNKTSQEQTALLSDEPDPTDLAAVVAGTTSFAIDLYAQLVHSAPSFFCSPASISLALAMTSAGARGETSAEMARALRFPHLSPTRIHAALGAVAQGMQGAPRGELAIGWWSRLVRRLADSLSQGSGAPPPLAVTHCYSSCPTAMGHSQWSSSCPTRRRG